MPSGPGLDELHLQLLKLALQLLPKKQPSRHTTLQSYLIPPMIDLITLTF